MTAQQTSRFILGLDLDGTCADFYSRMREIAAEWTGVEAGSLSTSPDWDMIDWGLVEGEYQRLHHFAVTQRRLFETMEALPGAPQALRRLATEGVRIRIITHRLFIEHFHETAVAQTVRWLDHHGIPYWDLCFMQDKAAVEADLYIEDSPENIQSIRDIGKPVIIFTNKANAHIPTTSMERATDWNDIERLIRQQYYAYLKSEQLSLPKGVGEEPVWL